MKSANPYKDPRWQKKRLEVLNEKGWRCEECGDKNTTLHVHHVYYVKGRDVWNYSIDDLLVLCEDCHKFTHVVDDDIKRVLSEVWLNPNFGIRSIQRICGYAEAVVQDGPNYLRVLDDNYADGIADFYRKSTQEILAAVTCDDGIPPETITEWWKYHMRKEGDDG